MTPDQIRLARALAYAGILPPWLGLLIGAVYPLSGVSFAALAYGACIASFVCGMHWAIALQGRTGLPVNLLLTSNIGTLGAWVCLLLWLWSPMLAFLGLAGVLVLLLGTDRRLLCAGALEPWFWQLRLNATLGLGSGLLLWSFLA